jgi:hypothetical protein
LKQTIAVIGLADPQVRNYIKQLPLSKCRLLIYSDIQEHTSDLIEELKIRFESVEAEPAESSIDAAWESDIIIFGLPGERSGEAEQIKHVVCRKTILAADSETAEELKSILVNSVIRMYHEIEEVII